MGAAFSVASHLQGGRADAGAPCRWAPRSRSRRISKEAALIRVLLVDDDEPTRLICRRILGRLDPQMEVDEVDEGRAAIDRLRGPSYHGVLSDYRLGAVSGLDVLAAARDMQPTAFRALMTGFADPTLLDVARQRADIHAFIEKPMTSGEFEAVLKARFVAPMAQARPEE